MKIISIRPHSPGGKTVARFDAELAEGVKAFDLKLVRGENGLRVYGPSLYGGAAITFPPAVANRLAMLVMEAVAHGSDSRTAA